MKDNSLQTKRSNMPSPGFQLDAFVPYLVNVLAGQMSRDLARVYQTKFGITIPEWRVLAHLAQNSDVSVREIHRRVDMDKAKVSRAAQRLEALGCLTKTVSAADKRLVALQLTVKGAALFAEISPLALAFEEQTLRVLSPDEQQIFVDCIRRLGKLPPEMRNTTPGLTE